VKNNCLTGAIQAEWNPALITDPHNLRITVCQVEKPSRINLPEYPAGPPLTTSNLPADLNCPLFAPSFSLISASG
jgi:hypothetical protein